MKDELLFFGAEAEIYKTIFLGLPAAYKKRVVKNYREKKLDGKIRFQRLQTEVNLLHKAKAAGVRTPVVYGVDRKNAGFWMEFLAGKRLKDELNKKKPGANGSALCSKAGEMIACLHRKGLVHGDLTTSNFMASQNELVLFDFGLGFFSEKTEDLATDLLNLKKTFWATHPNREKEWEKLLKSYQKNFVSGKKVVGQMAKIESRGRYN